MRDQCNRLEKDQIRFGGKQTRKVFAPFSINSNHCTAAVATTIRTGKLFAEDFYPRAPCFMLERTLFWYGGNQFLEARIFAQWLKHRIEREQRGS
jgi:hypothetical protein